MECACASAKNCCAGRGSFPVSFFLLFDSSFPLPRFAFFCLSVSIEARGVKRLFPMQGATQ